MRIAKSSELTPAERLWGMVVGGLLAVTALVVLYAAPTSLVSESYGDDGTAQTVREKQDTSTAFIAVFIGGVAMFGFSLNGLRLARISAGGLVAESRDAGSAAQEYADTLETDRAEPEELVIADNASPEAFTPPVRHVEFSDGTHAVYGLESVPVSVLNDAFSKWPYPNLPTDMGQFEFATRKKGRGNHPWTVKFRSHRPVVVSYGGQGKKDATVAQQDDPRPTVT